VKFHVSSILGKLGAAGRTEAVATALQQRLVGSWARSRARGAKDGMTWSGRRGGRSKLGTLRPPAGCRMASS
jgi:hypothetical protein